MYSLTWKAGSRYNETIDEIRIEVRTEEQIPALEEFLRGARHQRVVVSIASHLVLKESSISYLKSLFEKGVHDDWTVCYAEPLPAPIRFYFSYPAFDMDTFCYMAATGVTDIRIAGGLGFMLPDLSPTVERKGIKLRAQVNYASSSAPMKDIHRFFIRPEGAKFYNQFIDIFEFYIPDGANPLYEDTLYESYKNGIWYGELKEIISNLDLSLDSRSLSPMWEKKRHCCKRKCLIDFTRCQFCYRVKELEETMRAAGIEFNHGSD